MGVSESICMAAKPYYYQIYSSAWNWRRPFAKREWHLIFADLSKTPHTARHSLHMTKAEANAQLTAAVKGVWV